MNSGLIKPSQGIITKKSHKIFISSNHSNFTPMCIKNTEKGVHKKTYKTFIEMLQLGKRNYLYNWTIFSPSNVF